MSLEPGLILSAKLTPDTYFQGQIGEWIPIGGDTGGSGAIFNYRAALNHVIARPFVDSQFIATLEMVGYCFQDGTYTDPAIVPLSDASYVKSSGGNYVSVGPGVRWVMSQKCDFGFGVQWAVTENHPDIVKLLAERGADVNARTTVSIPKGEYVPARAGGASGSGIIRQRALPKADGGMSPLLFAVRDGNTAMTRLLLELGADIKQTSGNHTSPLLIALLNGQITMAMELLEKGADPNQADDYHRAALFAAIDLRNFNHDKYPFLYDDGRDPLELIKALLAKGANPNLTTDTVPVQDHAAPGTRPSSSSWVASLSGAQRSSSSQNATHGVSARSMPALRAPASPRGSS